jgi:hypothetical protein
VQIEKEDELKAESRRKLCMGYYSEEGTIKL